MTEQQEEEYRILGVRIDFGQFNDCVHIQLKILQIDPVVVALEPKVQSYLFQIFVLIQNIVLIGLLSKWNHKTRRGSAIAIFRLVISILVKC